MPDFFNIPQLLMTGARAVKKGVGYLGQQIGQGDDEDGPLPITPGINGEMPPIRATRPGKVSGYGAVSPPSGTIYDRAQRPDEPITTSTNAGDIPTQIEPRALPVEAPPLSLLTPTNIQSQQPLRAVVPSRQSDLPPSPVRTEFADLPAMGNPSAIAPPEQMRASRPMNDRREDVAVPRLPGEPGEPMAYTPGRAARYDYNMAIRKGDDGKTYHYDNDGNPVDNKAKRRFADVLKGIALGAVQGAQASPENRLAGLIGGAAVGGAGTAISPATGRDYQFDQMYAPEFRRQEAEDNARADRARKIEEDRIQMENRQANTDYTKAHTKATIAGMKDADMQRQIEESKLRWYQARQKAIESGKSTTADLVDDDGITRKYLVFGDGSKQLLGNSVKGLPKTATGRPLTASEAQKQAELERTANQGTPEAIAESSLQARMPSLRASLPAPVREIVESGTITRAGRTRPATATEVKQANEIFNKRVEQERKAILADTRSKARQQAAQGALEKLKPGASSVGQQTRNVGDLLKYFDQ